MSNNTCTKKYNAIIVVVSNIFYSMPLVNFHKPPPPLE